MGRRDGGDVTERDVFFSVYITTLCLSLGRVAGVRDACTGRAGRGLLVGWLWGGVGHCLPVSSGRPPPGDCLHDMLACPQFHERCDERRQPARAGGTQLAGCSFHAARIASRDPIPGETGPSRNPAWSGCRATNGPPTVLAARGIAVLIIGATFAAAIGRLRWWRIDPASRLDTVRYGLLVASGLVRVAAFPNVAGGGWTHIRRMVLLPFLAALLICAVHPWTVKTRIVIVACTGILNAVVIGSALREQIPIHRVVADVDYPIAARPGLDPQQLIFH